jgi:alpha-galactosidase
MVSSGMAAAGYQYGVVDDGWQRTGRRNRHVNLDPDFPNMKALGDYIHARGLKFGIDSDRGRLTCQNRVGAFGFEATGANPNGRR